MSACEDSSDLLSRVGANFEKSKNRQSLMYFEFEGYNARTIRTKLKMGIGPNSKFRVWAKSHFEFVFVVFAFVSSLSPSPTLSLFFVFF